MPRKPVNLVYGLEDRPPLPKTFFLGLQHVSIFFIGMIFPVIIARAANASSEETISFVSMSMLAGATGTILQAVGRYSIGCRYLLPQGPGPALFSSSIRAIQMGGFHLLFGMTLLSGIVESGFSRVMHKLRALFPAEVTGTLVAMVGITVIPVTMRFFLGVTSDAFDATADRTHFLVALISLGMMVGLNIWTRGNLKLFCVLIGMTFGYVLSYFTGILTSKDFQILRDTPVIAVPKLSYFGLSFSWSLVIPFVVAALASTFKSIGDVVLCQKINDADWKRPDMKNISAGINADGWSATIAGIIGGMGPSTYSANVGLSMATGATSRLIAYAMAAILIVLSFLPKLAAIFGIMPKPVMGAALVFAVSFMIVTGIQIIQSRILDARKIFVIGVSIIFGLSVDMLPGAYKNIPAWMTSFTSSSLSLATITALVLNAIMRIGIKKTAFLTLRPDENTYEKISTFMEKQGGAWGARKDVISNAMSAINEFAESAYALDLRTPEINVKASFDELRLDVEISYDGLPLEFPNTRPSKREWLTNEKAGVQLAGFLVKQYADQVTLDRKNDRYLLHLQFQH